MVRVQARSSMVPRMAKRSHGYVTTANAVETAHDIARQREICKPKVLLAWLH
jgi:hypothetical protein